MLIDTGTPFEATSERKRACVSLKLVPMCLCRKQILQYREESRQLDECERLKDSWQLKQVQLVSGTTEHAHAMASQYSCPIEIKN